MLVAFHSRVSKCGQKLESDNALSTSFSPGGSQ